MGLQFVFCAIALFTQTYGYSLSPYSHNGCYNRGCTNIESANYGINCNGIASTDLPVVSNAPIGLTVVSENCYAGNVNVKGTMPFVGTVALEGFLPSTGTGAVSYGCGDGTVGIGSERGIMGSSCGTGINTAGCGCQSGCNSIY